MDEIRKTAELIKYNEIIFTEHGDKPISAAFVDSFEREVIEIEQRVAALRAPPQRAPTAATAATDGGGGGSGGSSGGGGAAPAAVRESQRVVDEIEELLKSL